MRQGTELETRPPFTEQPKHLNLTHGNYTNDWLCLVLGDNLRFSSLGRSWRRLLFSALLRTMSSELPYRVRSRSSSRHPQIGSNSICMCLFGSGVSAATANIPSPRLRAEKAPLEQ